ncbi:FUSC family protein [Psychromarinibacter sp. S121]|uniref:FUSC family protein n=1 Tax=Psychromarinibacter sp. S121 TaxID=3415127 RepID=UPI003C7DBC22
MTLAGLGFDPARLRFGLRTALAACLAVFVAWIAGLEHPQWAGMSVWAASQPLRGQLVEKAFFRFAGTIVGSVIGVLLVLASGVHPWLLVIGLALWVALCTWAGNLLRGFGAYGTVLAGYTAAMVSLLDSGHGGVLALGLDRMATVLTGVAMATAVGLLFGGVADGGGLRHRLRVLLADLLDHVADAKDAPGEDGALLSRLAALDEALEVHAAGSLRSRRTVRAVRSMLLAAISLVFWRRGEGAVPEIEGALRRAATALRDDVTERAVAELDLARHALPEGHELAPTLGRLRVTMDRWSRAEAPGHDSKHPVVLHRDRAGAAEAAQRAGGSLLLFGALWLITGWSAGNFLLLGLSVMISLFSTFENPVLQMRHVCLGQIAGVVGALACRWLAWPLAGSEAEMLAWLVPFILFGPFLMAHRRTQAMSFDYNMVLLLMLQPHFPLTGSFGASVSAGLAVAAAPLAAMAAYRWIYPVNRRRRAKALLTAMLDDVAALAGHPDALEAPLLWRARLYHRTLRLVRTAEGAPHALEDALDAACGLFDLGRGVMACHALLADDATPAPVRRAARAALARTRALAGRPDRAGGAFDRLARRLAGPDRHRMTRAAQGAGRLTANPV